MSANSYDISTLPYDELGSVAGGGKWRFVWAHGWGQNRHAMAVLAQSLASHGRHLLVDFPGFGEAPLPDEAWSTADYADLMARFLAPAGTGETPPDIGERTVWIGHSFGGRVGIQLAARHPHIIDNLVLIASAGLQRNRSLADKAQLAGRLYTFKMLKHLAPLVGMDVDKLRESFGSADYKAAGPMRDTFINVVREDLSGVAAQIQLPTRLIYGADDGETPPDIGERLAALIPNAELFVLANQDHYSLLGEGRHQVVRRIRDFLEA